MVTMELQPRQPSNKGPAELFTGEVWIDPIVPARPPSHLAINAVHFTPGARTAWHWHSNGQTLFVTEGEGRVQSRGEPIVSIHPGDRIYTPDAEWHWHGAAPDRFMTHLSITEGDPHWGDHVTDAEYHGDGG
jgi:quercetin dioxygenase-like cupin family protein